MAKAGAGRKLGRKQGARVGLLRGLATSLLRTEQLQTTFPKAKECSRLTNQLITAAKAGDLNARREVSRSLADTEVVTKLFDVLAPRYANRQGGCTKIFRLQARPGDNAEMALIKLVA